MVDLKYLDPLRLNDEEEEQPKEDKPEQSPYLLKKFQSSNRTITSRASECP